MILDALAILLVGSGVLFLAVSAVGVLHLPGFFSRAHAVAKSETLGIMLTIGGLIVHHRFAEGSLQLVIVIALAMIANPTAVHALARAAAVEAEAPGQRAERAQGRGPDEAEAPGQRAERAQGRGPDEADPEAGEGP